MEKLTNVVVRDAYEGKRGVSKFGPWQAWNVYLQGYEEKFGYFEKDNIVPFAGMEIALLEYEVEQNGEYTNYTIKKMVPTQLVVSGALPVPGSKPVSTSKPAVKSGISGGLPSVNESKPVLMCTSYVKDIMVELIQVDDNLYRHAKISVIVDAIARGGKRLAKLLTGGEVPPVPMGGTTVVKPVTMTKPEPVTSAAIKSMNDGLPKSGLPVVSKEAIEEFSEKVITPEMVKLANATLPGAEPAYEDDVPF